MQTQKQSQIQLLIHTTFSCIAYLRDLLDDSCFEDQVVGKSVIKKLIRTPKTREILELLQGMYEAISRGFVSGFEVALYIDPSKSMDISESYTFEVNNKEESKIEEETIKKFCLVLQKLKPLPSEKYATIKLYYNETVPVDYNPRGFKDGRSHSFQYNKEKKKYEQVKMYIKDTSNGNKNILNKETNKGKNKGIPSTFNTTLQTIPNTTPPPTPNTTLQTIPNTTPPPTPNTTLQTIPNTTHTEVRCACDHNSDTFELIQCDECNHWLHTVCCGFFSNTDKRIPKIYYCGFCSGGVDKNRSIMRKFLSVVYNEGIRTKQWLMERIGMNKNLFPKMFNRLIEEGFVKSKGPRKIEIIKNEKIKKKIKEYFQEKRTSIPEKDIKCVV
ncbi:HORMA domain-containing protein 2 [Nosema granulosis]|uniref:HORMA domain-containing protein 2 n=1 Tax=Nosema granulosis TaxID=83296 RepID=A0A9P6GZM8_9MICR|nr:HORMA domain-containing protein 2 [Nosema granulosis]